MTHSTIVVGAGSAGAVLATRLTEDPDRHVLLLEAGPDYPDLDELPDELRLGHATAVLNIVSARHDWRLAARPTHYARQLVQVSRGKVTGGSSAINGQIFLRGLPEDYDGWAQAGNSGWSYADVLPYFQELEADPVGGPEHGSAGPIGVHRHPPSEWHAADHAFVHASRAAGFGEYTDANDPAASGVGPCPLNNPGGVRISTAIGYLPQARGRPNLELRADTRVRRVLFDGRRAVGVEIEGEGGMSVAEADEIVLCAGAVETPHLLLVSGVGPRHQLRAFGIPVIAPLDGVGKGLQDHPLVRLRFKLAPAHHPAPDAPKVHVLLRYTSSGSAARGDVTICPYVALDELWLFPSVHYALSRGELRLVSPDPLIQPSLDYNYLAREEDFARLRGAVKLCLELVRHESFTGVVTERVAPTDADLASESTVDDWLLANVSTSQHPTGTCRMGPASDPHAVADAAGRVHGLTALRIVDASLMPRIVRANTNVPAMMIGERIAALMRAESARNVHTAPPGKSSLKTSRS